MLVLQMWLNRLTCRGKLSNEKKRKAQNGTKEMRKDHVEKSLKAVFGNFNQF